MVAYLIGWINVPNDFLPFLHLLFGEGEFLCYFWVGGFFFVFFDRVYYTVNAGKRFVMQLLLPDLQIVGQLYVERRKKKSGISKRNERFYFQRRSSAREC